MTFPNPDQPTSPDESGQPAPTPQAYPAPGYPPVTGNAAGQAGYGGYPPPPPAAAPPAYYAQPYPGTAQKSKIAAGLLGIFLGGLGIHRFYLGYVGIGILQIVVTIVTFGIGSLWGFIEGIVILCTNDPNSKYGQDARGIPLTS